jgi:hypothetical protein
VEAREVRVPVRDFSVTASVRGPGPTVVALGHGAGGDRETPLLVRLAEAVAASGRAALLYNFPYTDAGRRVPDPPEVLEMTARAVAGTPAGRWRGAWSWAASRWAGASRRSGGQGRARGRPGLPGLPLHPPGRTQTRRDRHLRGGRAHAVRAGHPRRVRALRPA